MHGNTFSRSVRLAGHLVSHPMDAVAYVGDRMASNSPLDRALPWFSWSGIRKLDSLIKPGMRVFEWGVGGSTRFLLERGCFVKTAETSAEWAEIAKRLIPPDHQDRLELVLLDVSPTDEVLADAVNEGGPWDVVIVDGPTESRMRCMETAKANMKPDGFCVLDDAWRTEYDAATEIMAGYDRVRCVSNGPCRPGVTQTDFYLPRG